MLSPLKIPICCLPTIYITFPSKFLVKLYTSGYPVCNADLIRMEYQTRIENTASSIRTILNRMEEIELVDENGLTWQSDFSLAALMKHNLTETKNCEVDDEGIGSWMEQKKRILDVCEEISLKESQLKFQLVNFDDFLQDEKGYMENKQNKKKMIDDLKEKLCFLKEKPPVSCATD